MRQKVFTFEGRGWARGSIFGLSKDYRQSFGPFKLGVNNNRLDDTIEIGLGLLGSVKLQFSDGFNVYLSNISGGVAFLDVNGNEILDSDETSVPVDENGNFDFNIDKDDLLGEYNYNALGILNNNDANNNGLLDLDEGQMVVLSPTLSMFSTSVYSDMNNNNQLDDGELKLNFEGEKGLTELNSFDQIFSDPDSELGIWSIFDIDKDGNLTDIELRTIRQINTSTATPDEYKPVVIDTQIEGYIPYYLTSKEVFWDTNKNGIQDQGEISVQINSDGFYSFADETINILRLGLLAPYDTNNNGEIDPEEGVIVVKGGYDKDNGLENNITVKTIASGAGFGQTVNPFTTLQVSLVEQGLSSSEAIRSVATAFGIENIDLNSYNPTEANQERTLFFLALQK